MRVSTSSQVDSEVLKKTEMYLRQYLEGAGNETQKVAQPFLGMKKVENTMNLS